MLTIEVAILFIILYFITSGSGVSQFLTYMEPNYEGVPNLCSDDYSGCNVSELISIKIITGSCGQIFDSKSGNIRYVLEDIPNTNYYYEGLLTSCPTYFSKAECPSGTFVKNIQWDTEFNLTRGIKLSCNKPESNLMSEATNVFSHPREAFSKTNESSCAAFTAITIQKNISLAADIGLLIEDCAAGNGYPFDNTLACEPFTALAGITVSIESKTNYIKSSSIICRDIPDIAAECKPTDEKREIFLTFGHDNNIRKFVKRIGIALTSNMSESEKNEFNFYNILKPNFDYSLSTNFETNIGISAKTGYNFSTAPKSTWQEERNLTIEVEISSKCETVLFEIVGKCSYMHIRPYYLERVDSCNGTSFRTIEKISHEISRKSYKSEIPDLVDV